MKNKTDDIDCVNFEKFTLQKKEISINGKVLPLKIGDKFKLSENDRIIKTVMAITIFEDGRAGYLIEWYDPDACRFETETVTLSELKLLDNKNLNKIKKDIGFKQ